MTPKHELLSTAIYLHTCLQPPYCSTAISIASPTRPRTPSPFPSPIALPSYHPTHDSSAPRRALAGGAAEQLVAR